MGIVSVGFSGFENISISYSTPTRVEPHAMYKIYFSSARDIYIYIQKNVQKKENSICLRFAGLPFIYPLSVRVHTTRVYTIYRDHRSGR